MVKKKDIEFDDEQVVVIHDELAEIESEDPTFGGMREGARLEEAYPQMLAGLKEMHLDRFRHGVPADPVDLFDELADELHFPEEEYLRIFITKSKANERFSDFEEKRILAALKKLKKEVGELTFSE